MSLMRLSSSINITNLVEEVTEYIAWCDKMSCSLNPDRVRRLVQLIFYDHLLVVTFVDSKIGSINRVKINVDICKLFSVILILLQRVFIKICKIVFFFFTFF